MKNKRTLPETAVGLCVNRHNMPDFVKEYIFREEIKDVMDFDFMSKTIQKFLDSHCNPRITHRAFMGQVDCTDCKGWIGDPIDVISTGLTACNTQLVFECIAAGIGLTLWHYDRETGEYVPQYF